MITYLVAPLLALTAAFAAQSVGEVTLSRPLTVPPRTVQDGAV